MIEHHDDRIARMTAGFREAHGRFVRRLREAPRELVARTPPDGGWSAAQIGWHVAAVDEAFAGLISGQRRSQPMTDGFAERSWHEIAASVPAKLEASGAVVPPAGVDPDQVLAALDRAAQHVEAALASLTADRGASFGVTHHAVGTVTLYQVGEWAIAHTIRHNAQAKRVLTTLAAPSPSAGV